MTGLTILLIGLAGVLLICTVAAIYARESPTWRVCWRPDDEGPHVSALIQTRSIPGTSEPEPVEVGADIAVGKGVQAYPRDVFRYTIKRPALAVRRKAANLGGYSEVPFRLYDQLGNRLTVRQRVRLN